MIGLDGEVRDYPKFFFLKLKAINRNFSAAGMEILARDRETGYWRILPAIVALREILETLYYNPDRKLRSSRFQLVSGRRMISLWSMIGGLTSPVICQIEAVQRGPGTGQNMTILVAEVQARRLCLGP
jgi:hypothetical protein